MGGDGTLSSNQSSRSRYNIGALIYSLRNSSGIARVAQAALESCRSLEHRDLLMDLDQDAQDTSEVNVLKGRIWEAEAAQRNFSAGLPHAGS
jgi:hypothetical protein